MPKASVKIMKSYDYSHFEFTLSSDEDMTIEEIDEMGKEAQRQCDQQIRRYKVKKKCIGFVDNSPSEVRELERRVEIIKDGISESEYTPEHKAIIKALDDLRYRIDFADKYSYDMDDLPF